MAIQSQEKRCSKCKQWKPFSDFFADKGQRSGLRCACKACCRQGRVVYNQHNAEKITAARRADYQRNKAAYQARNRNTKRRDPLGNRLRANHSKARRLGCEGTFTAKEWRNLVVKYGHRCLCCGLQEPKITLTFDHVIPLVVGGRNDISNIQPLCLRCNQKKLLATTDYRS